MLNSSDPTQAEEEQGLGFNHRLQGVVSSPSDVKFGLAGGLIARVGVALRDRFFLRSDGRGVPHNCMRQGRWYDAPVSQVVWSFPRDSGVRPVLGATSQVRLVGRRGDQPSPSA